MYQRILLASVMNAMLDNPIVFIQGPLQVGKTSFVRNITQTYPQYDYCSLDIVSEFELAKSNPGNFLRRKNRLIIDEVLKVPELISEIKNCVNEDPLPGKFLLTSSTNIITIPKLREKLTSIAKFITLPPLAQCEIRNTEPSFLNILFSGSITEFSSKTGHRELIHAMLAGGFPLAITRTDENRRQSWFHSYLESICYQFDNQDSGAKSNIHLSQFVKSLSNYSGQLVDPFYHHKRFNLNFTMFERYLIFLERTHLILRIKPWPPYSVNQNREPTRIQFIDSGLLASLIYPDTSVLEQNKSDFSRLLNCFVGTEILKLTNQSNYSFKMFYFRSSDDEIVDIVLVRNDGLIAGIVIQPNDSIDSVNMNSLTALMSKSGQKFTYGTILYSGKSVLKLTENIFALPISSLWSI